MSSVEDQFKAAAAHFGTIVETASDKDKLIFYALWNQATNGDVNLKEEPSKMNMVAHYKFQARKRVRGMTKEQAMKKYVTELLRVDPSWVAPGGESKKFESTASQTGEEEDDELDFAGGSGGRKTIRYAAPTPNKTEMEKVRPTFEAAVEFARTSGLFRSQATRSILYAHYKQATVGPCFKPAPGLLAGRKAYARWRAWKDNFDMKPEEAMRKYVDLVRKVAPEFEAKDPSYFMTAGGAGADLFQPRRTSMKAPVKVDPTARPITVAQVLEAMDKVRQTDAKEMIYLLTGASGFVGKFLIRELLEKHPMAMFLCVTRQSSFGKLMELFPNDSNVIPVAGDLASPNLGLAKELLLGLQSRGVNHFYHLAAMYDMKASKEANEKANVQGTREAVNVANALGVKTVFQYTSSIAVAGDYDGIFTEDMFNEGQYHEHDYLRTKFLAEEVVRKECKVPFRIYRPGMVLGSTETGEADKIDGPYYLFKPLQHLKKVLPQLAMLPCIQGEPMPIVPVDYVAKAMAFISHRPGLDGRVFCLVDPDPPMFVDLLNLFAKAAGAPQFSSRIPELVLGMIPRKANAALQDIPIIADAPFSIGAHILGVPHSVMAYVSSKTTFDDTNTQEALRGSGIKCPSLESYAWRLWDYYLRFMDPANDPFGALSHEVRNKVVVVTGSSDGIGEVLAGRLAKAGAKVVLVARSKEKLDKVAKEIADKGGKAFIQVADLSDKDSTQKAVVEILKAHGKVDILVNNAGRSIRRSVEYQTDPERFHDFTRTMDLNAYGAVRMSLGVLPSMRKQKEGQIINVSSIGVLTGPPRFGAYVASKAYVDAFARCVSSECASDNVVFTSVYIPLTKTKMVVSKDNKYDHVKLYTPLQSAGLIERAIVTKERKVLTSTAWWVSIGYFLWPSAVEGVMNIMYKLEPEAAPSGQAASAAAMGDKQQLKKLGNLFSGVL